ncbi:expressed unknown protein [Seminavis robusta]|uniref:Uncharacterized protein n=1 Tax=Seminavis robusta TaxID=568900 RepID=A0A9N8HKS1_9STRA|nr:expressed unknown protein [Seminavis robusta]|eukprot:Sro861_g212190.1 n/a (121) ;mRNA; f:9879-10413
MCRPEETQQPPNGGNQGNNRPDPAEEQEVARAPTGSGIMSVFYRSPTDLFGRDSIPSIMTSSANSQQTLSVMFPSYRSFTAEAFQALQAGVQALVVGLFDNHVGNQGEGEGTDGNTNNTL